MPQDDLYYGMSQDDLYYYFRHSSVDILSPSDFLYLYMDRELIKDGEIITRFRLHKTCHDISDLKTLDELNPLDEDFDTIPSKLISIEALLYIRFLPVTAIKLWNRWVKICKSSGRRPWCDVDSQPCDGLFLDMIMRHMERQPVSNWETYLDACGLDVSSVEAFLSDANLPQSAQAEEFPFETRRFWAQYFVTEKYSDLQHIHRTSILRTCAIDKRETERKNAGKAKGLEEQDSDDECSTDENSEDEDTDGPEEDCSDRDNLEYSDSEE
ncbi:hypothetical protein B0T21DRAFT_358894 [Apiosordaria backusii]|uniref:Uncharacterized protein n=1 Tax=Apiosordaria backusii TaxID=314023 RepID=A0AA40ET44_9PEZI|nr:hypothetical protein B0T21DRAFT_358894 [Apiosordaria backusii]